MASKPLWRRAFDQVEGPVGSALADVARSGAFAEAVGLAMRTRAGVRHELERRTRRLWHLANLPAGSDVKQLRRQVASLDRELRRVHRALEALGERQETNGDGSARSRPARRRT